MWWTRRKRLKRPIGANDGANIGANYGEHGFSGCGGQRRSFQHRFNGNVVENEFE
jgi:hypothetical protein